MKERIVILDHDNHRCFIEDIDMDMLDENYDGQEEEYIKAHYTLGEFWTWDFVTDIEYVNDEEPIDLDIEAWID